MSTFFLNKSATLRAIESVRLFDELKEALNQAPPLSCPAALSGKLHDFGQLHARGPGLLPTVPAYTFSVSAHFRQSRKPYISLFDLKEGSLLALIEGQQLLQLTQSLVNALAAEALTPASASTLAVFGANDDSRRFVKSLRLVRSLRDVKIFDPDLERAQYWAAEMFGNLSLPTYACRFAEEALEEQSMLFVGTDCLSSLAEIPWPEEIHVTFQSPSGLSESVLHMLPFSLFTDDATCVEGAEDLSALLHQRTAPPRASAFVSGLPPMVELVAAWHVYQGARAMEEGQPLELEA